jgi:hypothetical protein
MTRKPSALPPSRIYFRPRHDGCGGGGDNKPLKMLNERQAMCPECLGTVFIRKDGKMRYHRRLRG